MLHLPDEILLAIFSCLQLPTVSFALHPESHWSPQQPPEVTTLARLCQASRRFCNIAQPLLYDAIPDQNVKNRMSLLRTLCRHPHLAGMVRTIALHERHWVNPWSALQQCFRDAQRGFRLPISLDYHFTKTFGTYLPNRDGELPSAALTVALLPNLETLVLISGHQKNELLSEVFREAGRYHHLGCDAPATSRRPLSRLREIHLKHGQQGDTDMTEYDEFLLPTVETFRGHALAWDADPDWPERKYSPDAPAARPLALRHLDLTWSLCNAEGLARVLARCPALETLRLEWGPTSMRGRGFLDFNKMGEALRASGRRLGELHLRRVEDLQFERRPTAGRLGSLRPLARLRALSVPHSMLVGRVRATSTTSAATTTTMGTTAATLDEVLPGSLERLLLYCDVGKDDESLDEAIYNLVACGRMARLSTVQVSRNDPVAGGPRRRVVVNRSNPFPVALAGLGCVVTRSGPQGLRTIVLSRVAGRR